MTNFILLPTWYNPSTTVNQPAILVGLNGSDRKITAIFKDGSSCEESLHRLESSPEGEFRHGSCISDDYGHEYVSVEVSSKEEAQSLAASWGQDWVAVATQLFESEDSNAKASLKEVFKEAFMERAYRSIDGCLAAVVGEEMLPSFCK